MSFSEGVAGFTGKTVRPVKCLICKEQMFYKGQEGFEPEFTLHLEDRETGELLSHYVHKDCWEKAAKGFKAKKKRIKGNDFRRIKL
jgi:hypothetical protein